MMRMMTLWVMACLCCLPLNLLWGQHTTATPESKVNAIIAGKTFFPDSYYETFDWIIFEGWPPANRAIDPNRVDYNLLHAAIFYHTNKVREAEGLTPFEFSAELRNSAVFHCTQMIDLSFFSHDNPYQPQFNDMLQRARYFACEHSTFGENIAEEYLCRADDVRTYWHRRQPDGSYVFYEGGSQQQGKPIPRHTYNSFAKNLVTRWLGSPGHRKNLLSTKFTEMGCGVTVDYRTTNTTVIPMAVSTQNFGG